MSAALWAQAPSATPPENLCTVQGHAVNSATGEPLRSVAVTLHSAASDLGVRNPYTAATDASGNFTMGNVEPGQYWLSASRTGFVDFRYGSRGYLRIILAAQQKSDNLVLSMAPYGAILGKVTDEEGEAVAGLQVQALRYRFMQGRRQLAAQANGSTNDIGEFRVAGLPPGRYLIAVDAPPRPAAGPDAETYVRTFFPSTADPVAAAFFDVAPLAQVRGADVTLVKQQTVSVKGTLVDASGGSPRGFIVLLAPRGPLSDQRAIRARMLGDKGEFEVRGVIAGAYSLFAAAMTSTQEPIRSARIPVDVGQQNLDGLMLIVPAVMALTGHVQVEGQTGPPATKLHLALAPLDSGNHIFSDVAADGSFSIARVNPNRYSLTLISPPDGAYVKSVRVGTQETSANDIDLSHGGAATLEILVSLKAGTITGVVQNSAQQTAAGVTVVAVPQEPARKQQARYYGTAVADASGHYVIKNLDPGRYLIYAWPEADVNSYMDPDFLGPVENRGEPVTIQEGSQETVALKLIE
jgi:hypothetical protein